MGSLVFVAGARPNFVKIAPILRALARRGFPDKPELVHTGQHYDFAMSGVFFEQLGLPPPDVHLQVGSASHAVQTGRVMIGFDEYLDARSERAACVVVVGDVNSTMACALVAAKRNIPVVHVEAGLRSFDATMPEEVNRIVTDAVSTRLLVSEPSGLENLAREGIEENRIRYCGNVMIDTLVNELPAARLLGMPARFGLDPRRYAIATVHRPSNVDDPRRLGDIVDLLANIAARTPVVWPLHPRTRSRLDGAGLVPRLGAVRIVEPLGYREFLGLVEQAGVVISDSGGLQEETTYMGVPCVTLRSSTERPVTVTHGTNVLVGDSLDAARREIDQRLNGIRPTSRAIEGWDGQAAERVVDALYQLVMLT